VWVPVAAAMEEEESGWKYIHGDVFRFPPNKSLFCSFVGTGTQVSSYVAEGGDQCVMHCQCMQDLGPAV